MTNFLTNFATPTPNHPHTDAQQQGAAGDCSHASSVDVLVARAAAGAGAAAVAPSSEPPRALRPPPARRLGALRPLRLDFGDADGGGASAPLPPGLSTPPSARIPAPAAPPAAPRLTAGRAAAGAAPSPGEWIDFIEARLRGARGGGGGGGSPPGAGAGADALVPPAFVCLGVIGRGAGSGGAA